MGVAPSGSCQRPGAPRSLCFRPSDEAQLADCPDPVWPRPGDLPSWGPAALEQTQTRLSSVGSSGGRLSLLPGNSTGEQGEH